MKTLTLPDGSNLPVPAPRNKGVELLYAEDRMSRLPIPPSVHAPQFMLAVLAEANKMQANVEPKSIVMAAFNCACLGLIPGSQLGHAHFVPFKNRKRQITECQLIVGYKGYLELAYRARFLKDVHCQVVLQSEEFEYWVDTNGPQVRHQLPVERDAQWEKVQAAYCVWHSVAGGHGIEVVGRKELEKLYRRGNVWHSDPIPMCKKTPLRRSAKTWKQTQELGWAVHLDDTAERGETQELVNPALEPEEDDSAPPLTTGAWPTGPQQPTVEPPGINKLPPAPGESTDPHQAAGDAAQREAAAGANGTSPEPEQPTPSIWDQYEAELADASGIHQVDGVSATFVKLPGLNEAELNRAVAMGERRKAEIRASRGGKTNDSKLFDTGPPRPEDLRP